MPDDVQVACCQIAPRVSDPVANVALVREAIAAAIEAGAQLVVVPELACSGYVFESVDEARAAAEPPDGPALAGWAAEARRGGAVIVGGFVEEAGGRLFNSCALVDGEGVRAIYRKIHLWADEPRWFSPGDAPAPVVDTQLGRIGLAVCYDLEFPELTRGLALSGAELIAVPANWPKDPQPWDVRPVLVSLASTTAYWSKVFVAVCDRCGIERDLEFQGASVIAGPDGRLLAGPPPDGGAETVQAGCALGDARAKRNGAHNDAFADRRPELYSGGTAPAHLI